MSNPHCNHCAVGAELGDDRFLRLKVFGLTNLEHMVSLLYLHLNARIATVLTLTSDWGVLNIQAIFVSTAGD